MDDFSQPLEDRKMEKGFIVFGAIASLVLGVVIMICFVAKVMNSHSIPKDGEVLNFEHWGAFGDFIAGVVGTLFSLGGFFLLYLTLKDQRENFYKERLESNFFEMVRFHRDNVSELQFTYYEDAENKVIAEKRKVFKIIVLQFREAWDELAHFFAISKPEIIYENAYLDRLKKSDRLEGRGINFIQLARIDIVYNIIFFGLSKEDRQTIEKRFEGKYKSDFVNRVLEYASMKPKRESKYWDRWERISSYVDKIKIFNEIIKKRMGEDHKPEIIPEVWINFGSIQISLYYPDDYFKYYGGHQFRLGHYYRHMYAAVNFIDRERNLSAAEKYYYIKILRVQLSNYEQIALFLNTVSGLGRAWELQGERMLISTYNLITNIPSQNIMGDINLIDYYPDVVYAEVLS